jgi:hypothetical protein
MVQQQTSKSGHTTRAPDRFGFNQYNLLTQRHVKTEYLMESAKLLTKTTCHYNNMININKIHNGYAVVETFSLKKGLKQIGEKGFKAAFDEIKQLHDWAVFKPIHVNKLAHQEKVRAMESLIFLVKKQVDALKHVHVLMVEHNKTTLARKMLQFQQH